MVCRKCHKNLATIRYAEVIDGTVTDVMICRECYERMEQEDSSGFEIAGAAPTPKRPPAPSQKTDTLARQQVCRSCGMGLPDALQEGRVGCAVCYEQFGPQLDAYLEARHAGLEHRGKTPHLDNAREQARTELQTKRALLRSALETENYEDAAVLRDAIRDLESALGASAAGQD